MTQYNCTRRTSRGGNPHHGKSLILERGLLVHHHNVTVHVVRVSAYRCTTLPHCSVHVASIWYTHTFPQPPADISPDDKSWQVELATVWWLVELALRSSGVLSCKDVVTSTHSRNANGNASNTIHITPCPISLDCARPLGHRPGRSFSIRDGETFDDDAWSAR